MTKRYLKKVMLVGSIAFGAAASASIPFGSKTIFQSKEQDPILKPDDGSLGDGSGSDTNNPGDNGSSGNGSTNPDNGNDTGNNGGNTGGDNTSGGNTGSNEGDTEIKGKTIVITKQPSNVSVNPNETATFSFEYKSYNLSPNDRIYFQWYKDGKILPGKTSQTLTLNNVYNTDDGEYHVEITIGYYLFFKSNSATLSVKEESSLYDSIVFVSGTPSAYFYNFESKPTMLKIDAFVKFSKDGRFYFNDEKIKVDFYLEDKLVTTMYTGPGNNVLYAMFDCKREDVVGKVIRVVATYGQLTREERITTINGL